MHEATLRFQYPAGHSSDFDTAICSAQIAEKLFQYPAGHSSDFDMDGALWVAFPPHVSVPRRAFLRFR
jgi:hypothetical protein